jgi:signal transduction histidine kinase
MNDILEFAQLEKGKLDVRMQDVAVSEAVARAEELLSLGIREAGLRYERSEVAAGLVVRADPERLQQILLNLLTNAMKFTAAGGTIGVSCGAGEDRVRIFVRDSGKGIPAAELERIFEPFVQVDPERQPSRQRGVGLVCRSAAIWPGPWAAT